MSKLQLSILYFVCTFVLISYAIAGFFAHPSADDFTYALLGRTDDFLQTVLNERERWNGRFISNFIIIFSPLNWGGLMGYQLMPTLLISLILLGTYSIYRILINSYALLLALSSTVIMFSIMPDITEGIYWYTGAWTYIPGGVLFILGIALIIKYQDQLNFKNLVLPVSLFVLSAGFNEVIPVYGFVAFMTLMVFHRKFKLIGLLFTSLFILLLSYVLLAPGNEVRDSNFTQNHDLFYSVYMGMAYTLRFIGEWALNPAFYLWSVFLLAININEDFLRKLAILKNPLVALFIIVTPVFLACFAPIWSTGILGQYRTSNLSSYFYVISWSLILISNKDVILKKIRINTRSSILFGTLIISLLLWKNQYFLFTELASGQISQFDYEMNNRAILLKECNGDCFVPRIENQPRTLFVYPLQDDPKHWLNDAYAKYYGLERVIVKSHHH